MIVKLTDVGSGMGAQVRLELLRKHESGELNPPDPMVVLMS